MNINIKFGPLVLSKICKNIPVSVSIGCPMCHFIFLYSCNGVKPPATVVYDILMYILMRKQWLNDAIKTETKFMSFVHLSCVMLARVCTFTL